MHSIGRHLATLLLLAFPPLVAAAQLTITGRITGDAGNPLPVAQVLIEGTTVGTATNADGTYRLVIPAPRAGMVLVVRSIAYKPARQAITETDGTITRDFRLMPDVLRLGEVVVTAPRGETERTTLGMTISTVGGEEIARAPVAQIDA